MYYSQKTQELIDRICRNVERKDFVLEKEKAEESILRTYDLFGLTRPKNIIWCKDIFEDIFLMSAERAERATRAWRAAGSAGSAWRSAGSAWRSAWRSTESAESAWRSTESALDYNFNWYVFEFEY